MTPKRIGMKLLVVFAAVAATACSVDEAGKIKCADDASCPSDYPVCNGGVCIAGTSTTQNSVALVGVPGKQATDPVRGTVTVQVAGRASSGVASVTLSSGAQTFTGTASGSPGVFNVPVDTTKFADGSVTLTAALTAGNGSTATASGSLVVDNTAPNLTSIAFASGSALNGALVQADVTSNEKLASFTATISPSGSSFGAGTELSPATPAGAGEVRHLSFTINDTVAPGPYTIAITGKDAAGNTSTVATKDFVVDAASGGLGGAATITKGTTATLSANFGVPPGGTAKLTNDKNASVVVLSGSPAAITVSPDQTTTYTLTVSGVSGTFSPAGVTITVVDATDISAFTPSATSVSVGDTVTLTAAVANATAAGVTGSTTASLFTNATCTGTPVTATVAVGAGVGTVSFAPTASSGSVTGTPQSYCVSIPNAAGTPTKANVTVSVFTAAAGSIAFKAGSSGPAGDSVTLTVSGVPVSTGASIAGGYTASVNGVPLTQNGDVTFSSVVVDTVFSLRVVDPAGGVHTVGTTPATYTATPRIQNFTAVISPVVAGASTTSATVGTTQTMNFNLTYLPGGNGTATGTITATQASVPVNVFTGTVSTIFSIVSGVAQNAVTVNMPGTPGTLVFTPRVGSTPGPSVSISLVDVVSGATLTGATTITIGNSATLTVGYGTNGQTVTVSNNRDSDKVTVTNPTSSVTVTPGTVQSYTYTAAVTNSLGGGSQTTSPGVVVNVVERASVSAGPSASNVTQGTTFSVTANVNNFGSAGGQLGTTTATLFSDATCTTPSVATANPITIGAANVDTNGVATVTFVGVPAPTGSNAGTTATFCVTVPNRTGGASKALLTVTSFTAPSNPTNFFATTSPSSALCTDTSDCRIGNNAAVVQLKATFANGIATLTASNGATFTGTLPGSGTYTNLSTLFPSITSITTPVTFTLTVRNGAGGVAAVAPVVVVAPKLSSTSGPMPQRSNATATLMPNGRVLIAGGTLNGTPTRTSVVFDPTANPPTFATIGSDTVASTANLQCARSEHGAVLLPSGRVLVAGGCASNRTTDLFDPSTNTYSAGPLLVHPLGRKQFTLSLVPAATPGVYSALVAGGRQIDPNAGVGNEPTVNDTIQATETWDLNTAHNFAAGPNLVSAQGRALHSANVLSNRKVLLAGGETESTTTIVSGLATAEVVDLGSAVSTNVTGGMNVGRQQHAALLLSNGAVMLFGGKKSDGTVTATVEYYDVNTNLFDFTSRTPIGTARFGLLGTSLPDGQVLLTGGATPAASNALDIYNPLAPAGGGVFGVLDSTGPTSLLSTRVGHSQTPLLDGRVAVFGGNAGTSSAPAEIYDVFP